MDISQIKKYHLVGVSGHRDLFEDEIEKYKEEIKEYLKALSSKTDKPLLLVSPLADGADRLFVYAGKELGIAHVAVLPMPIEYYIIDFDEKSTEEFYQLFYNAKSHFVIPYANGVTSENVNFYGPMRDKQYRAVGLYLCDFAQDMLILWDGKFNQKTGGTSDIISYLKNHKKTYWHILCKRRSSDGSV